MIEDSAACPGKSLGKLISQASILPKEFTFYHASCAHSVSSTLQRALGGIVYVAKMPSSSGVDGYSR